MALNDTLDQISTEHSFQVCMEHFPEKKISLNKFKKIGMITSILFNIVVEQECTELEKKKQKQIWRLNNQRGNKTNTWTK